MPAAVMGASCYLLLSCLGFAVTVQAQSCSKPVGGPNMVLKDTDILLENFPDGTKVTFTCESGYVSAGGSPSITCTAGSWSPVRLRCERYNCGAFPDVLNGHVHYPEDTQFGSKVVFTCNEGYMLVGKKEIFCGAGGWMGRPPVCEVLYCEPPQAIVNGSFSPPKDNYEYAEIVQYRCKNDLELIGQSTLTCGENGKFQPDPPTCRYIECPELVIPNGEWISGSRPPHKHKATVTFRCKAGYHTSQALTLICESNNQWSPEPPTCKAIPTTTKATTTTTPTTTSGTTTAHPGTCERPHVEHGDLVTDGQPPYTVGSTVTFTCSSGFKMKGEATQTCDTNGHWSPGLPKCEHHSPIIIIVVVSGTCVLVVVAIVVAVVYKKKKQGPKERDPGNQTTDPAEKVELQSA